MLGWCHILESATREKFFILVPDARLWANSNKSNPRKFMKNTSVYHELEYSEDV